MKTHVLRLRPGEDLTQELLKFVREEGILAGFVLGCVGSIDGVTLRLLVSGDRDFEGCFEIISLAGSLCQDGIHLHMAISDSDGNMIGGHLEGRCPVRTTAEILIGELEDLEFSRKLDEKTRHSELVISSRKT